MWTGGRAGAWGSTCRGAFPMGSEWFKVREWVRQPCSGLRVTDPAPAAAPPATPGRPRGRCWEGHRGGGSPCGLGVERDSAWKQGGLPPSALPGVHFPGASSCSTTARVFLLGSGRRSVLRLSDASGTWSLGVRGRGTAGPLRPMSPLAQGSGGQGWSRSAAARSASRCSALTARRSRKREAPTLMDALGCSSGSFIFTDPFDTRMGCKKASAQGTTD